VLNSLGFVYCGLLLAGASKIAANSQKKIKTKKLLESQHKSKQKREK